MGPSEYGKEVGVDVGKCVLMGEDVGDSSGEGCRVNVAGMEGRSCVAVQTGEENAVDGIKLDIIVASGGGVIGRVQLVRKAINIKIDLINGPT